MESIQNINRNSFEEVDLLNKQADEARKDNNNLSLSVSKEAISMAQLLGYSAGKSIPERRYLMQIVIKL